MNDFVKNNTNKRIEYIDCMRGFTMILVVYSHVLVYVFGNNTVVNDIFILFRMPLFFFISGFMAFSSKECRYWIKKRFKNRLLNQFLPTFVTGGLFVLCQSGNLLEALFSQYKSGYWFTIVLFEIFCLYLVLSVIMDALKLKKSNRLLIYLLVIVLSFILQFLMYRYKLANTSVSRLCCLDFMLTYTRYFFLGIISRAYFSQFIKIVNNNYATTVFIAAFILTFCLMPKSTVITYFLGIMGVLTIYRIFCANNKLFSCETRIGRRLSYIGRNTLQVYFLHFFLLTGLSFQSYNGIIFDNWLLELIIVFAISYIIVMLTLYIDKVIESVGFMHTLLFGPKIVK